jgi:alpha-glucuronidase
VTGATFERPLGGFVAVVNVGLSANWLSHDLAMANLYAFGRLAWNPDTSARAIASDWVRLTFGDDPLVVQTISGILMDSWPAYEHYTGPLGGGGGRDEPGAPVREHDAGGTPGRGLLRTQQRDHRRE